MPGFLRFHPETGSDLDDLDDRQLDAAFQQLHKAENERALPQGTQVLGRLNGRSLRLIVESGLHSYYLCSRGSAELMLIAPERQMARKGYAAVVQTLIERIAKR